jgi:aspartyl-tRNA(Asn)/glutamyl-tRNA(Gln) amidotransferase subunit A
LSVHDLTATEIAAAVRARRLAAVDVVRACLDRAAELDGSLGTLVHVAAEEALEAAARLDRAAGAGEPLGPLAGVPLVVKDNLLVRGWPTRSGSRILEGHVAAGDAAAVARARAAGAIPFAAGNLDEFGMGSSGETSAHGPTRNPWDPERVPGGSSSGPAAAVAARIAPLALGSDTGGSVRLPAALCGVVGVRPTYGRVSRRGLVAFASSLDQVGPIARTVRDAAALLAAIAGRDPGDATSGDGPPIPVPEDGPLRLDGVRLATSPDLRPAGCEPDVPDLVDAALETFRSLGAEIHEVRLPHVADALAAYYLIADAEASTNLARYDGIRYGRTADDEDLRARIEATRDAGFGREVKRRILLGTLALSAGRGEELYLQARRVRVLVRREFQAALGDARALVGPTSPFAAFRLGERLEDPLALYACDVLTVPASLAGLPALSVPAGLTRDERPVGLQLVGAAGGESTLLRIAAAFEDVTGHHRELPRGIG